jgi:hypothetical protein
MKRLKAAVAEATCSDGLGVAQGVVDPGRHKLGFVGLDERLLIGGFQIGGSVREFQIIAAHSLCQHRPWLLFVVP